LDLADNDILAIPQTLPLAWDANNLPAFASRIH